MPVILAIVGAFFSGLFMWVVWGNGMEVINHWLDQRAERKKVERDTRLALENRMAKARAPLRAIIDPREGALALLSKLAMLRGEITMEQNSLLSRFATERLQLPGKAEHHTALAAFNARAVDSFEAVIDDLAPLFRDTLTDEEAADLFAMMWEVAGLHGGPTEAQLRMVERMARVFGYDMNLRGSEPEA
jgi:uncharacterized tellurite resistance protein B-like protein